MNLLTSRLRPNAGGPGPIAAILALAWIASAAGVDLRAEGDNVMKPKQYFVQLSGTRPGWPENMTADEERIMNEHFEYLKGLTAQKKVLMAGPCFNPVFGLIVLQTQSEAEARQIMDNEPSVKQGVHTYTLAPMHVALLADYQSPSRYPAETSDKTLQKEVDVPATIEQVWEAWTTVAGLKTFFAEDAKVELRVGGPFEIYFSNEPPYGSRGSEDCRVLSFLPKQMLSFEWNAPPKFGALRFVHTRVVLQFSEPKPGTTHVTLTQLGWGIGEKWDEIYAYFDSAWSYVLNNLKKRFAEAPLNREK